MFPAGELKALHARKLQLLDDSAAHRQLAAEEIACIQQRLVWLEHGLAITRRVLPFCTFAIPLLQFWRPRRAGGTASIWRFIVSALPVARRLVTIWQSVQR
jgi:hypothetical protein